MKYPLTIGLFVFATACAPDPMVVDVRVDPATADFSVGELTPAGVELPMELSNHGSTNAAVLATALTGDAAGRLELRGLPPRQIIELNSPEPFSLVLIDTQDLDVSQTAELAITIGGYGGLGEQQTLRVPVTFEGVPSQCDDDGDGFEAISCGGDDCDDLDFAVNPGAEEACNGIDDDCSGTIDDGIPDLEVFYADGDGDGFGADTEAVEACVAPEGFVQPSGDCDDARVDVYPGAPEEDCDDPTDYNCDGVTGFEDNDGDGFAACEDCDDTNDAINPGGIEVCDSLDNDCDGVIDPPGSDGEVIWFPDADGDTFGDAASPQSSCEVPADGALDGSDCDDTDPMVNPGAVEMCDGRDTDCNGIEDDNAIDALTLYADSDDDGFGNIDDQVVSCTPVEGVVDNFDDCDDTNDEIFPGAEELCDGLDNDCNAIVDDGAAGGGPWYADADGDGFGDPLVIDESCEQPVGFVTDPTDCDDNDTSISPDADERCDGIDNDCDETVDEADAIDAVNFFADTDGDGFGDASVTTLDCAVPPGFTDLDTDCDDNEASISPNADELCDGIDNDCDETVDEADAIDAVDFFADADGDGFGDASVTALDCVVPPGFTDLDTDCDDNEASINPDADELCNGIDDNCDGQIDEDSAGSDIWYADVDGDGTGDDANTTTSCSQPVGYVPTGGDCDDNDPTAFPSPTFRAELCDGVDNDCDGEIDEGWSPEGRPVWADADGDGFGGLGTQVIRCEAGPGQVLNRDDCDDTNAGVNPDADELCNNIDDNCDGTIDEDTAIDAISWFADADSDSFGDAGTTTVSCEVPVGFTPDNSDCDDGDAGINPAASEICNSIDDNCDGAVDEDNPSAPIWFADIDGDGRGDDANTANSCTQPSGYVAQGGDCDDNDPTAFPSPTFRAELCDGVDNDCDGQIDEGWSPEGIFVYDDLDGDAFGAVGTRRVRCAAGPGEATNRDDCDDGNASINPDADEVCNSVDDNCDGTVDEDNPAADTWFADVDGDGRGDDTDTVNSCTQPSGYVAQGGDCDDNDPTAFPSPTFRAELCDGVDNDCDGQIDEGWSPEGIFVYDDLDGDNYGAVGTRHVRCAAGPGEATNRDDCDDGDASINPDGTEVCDGADNDCDGDTDPPSSVDAATWFADSDGDTWGDASVTEVACTQPSGFVSDDLDCDDTDANVSPSEEEACGDSIDNDCDGTVDISGIDSDGDGIDNCIDADLYLEDFAGLPDQTQDSFDSFGWSTADFASMTCCGASPLGYPQPTPPGPGNASNWNLESGVLWEASNAAHSIAYSPYHGLLPNFVLSSDISGSNTVDGINNDAAGLFFGFRDTSNFLLVRWDNPFGSYSRYGFLGSLDLIQCVDATCSTLDSTNGTLAPSSPGSFENLEVLVTGRDVLVLYNGIPTLAATVPGSGPLGPGSVGAYAFDTDSGVFYDNFSLFVP